MNLKAAVGVTVEFEHQRREAGVLTFAILRDRAVIETVEVDAQRVRVVARIYGEAARRNRAAGGPRYEVLPVLDVVAEAC